MADMNDTTGSESHEQSSITLKNTLGTLPDIGIHPTIQDINEIGDQDFTPFKQEGVKVFTLNSESKDLEHITVSIGGVSDSLSDLDDKYQISEYAKSQSQNAGDFVEETIGEKQEALMNRWLGDYAKDIMTPRRTDNPTVISESYELEDPTEFIELPNGSKAFFLDVKTEKKNSRLLAIQDPNGNHQVFTGGNVDELSTISTNLAMQKVALQISQSFERVTEASFSFSTDSNPKPDPTTMKALGLEQAKSHYEDALKDPRNHKLAIQQTENEYFQ